MSSSPPQEAPPESVDALVLAGSRGGAAFRTLHGETVAKPYLRLGGQSLVARAVAAVLATAGIGRVYVVGEPAGLERHLAPLCARHGDRLALVAEGADILDNCLLAYFDHILPARGYAAAAGLGRAPGRLRDFRRQHPAASGVGMLVVASDLPFLTTADVEHFMRRAPADVALVAGLCDHAELERMQQALGRQTVLDRWKLGAIPMRRCDARWNNLWMARPLLGDPVLYSLLEDIYARRWLLDQKGHILWRNWFAILRAVASHSLRMPGRLRFLRGVLNAFGLMMATGAARWTRRLARWLARPFRLFLGQRDLEFAVSLLLGTPARMVISRRVGPAIDIDVEDSYRSLAAGGEDGYRRVARYLGLDETAAPADGDGGGLKVIAGGGP